ncbi:hypothetical protein QQ054_27375 [Oscillatoria amoena NRMC-F 0135]|nr:hypothetical protein [Oscillatoria amoena NRMC-F 0135]
MKNPSHLQNRHNSGITLVAVMGTVVLMAAFIGTAAHLNNQTQHQMKRSTEFNNTLTVADAALQRLYGDLTAVLNLPGTLPNGVNLQTLTATFNTTTAPTNIFAGRSYTYLNYTAIPLTTNGTPSFNPDSSIVDGRQYRFMGVVWLQDNQNPEIIIKLQQEMQFQFEPLYTYGIFYENDMEMHNGPLMNIGGRVHANGTIYYFNEGTINHLGPVSSFGGAQQGAISNTLSWNQGRTNATGAINYLGGSPVIVPKVGLPASEVLATNANLTPESMSIYKIGPNSNDQLAISNVDAQLIKRPFLGETNSALLTTENDPMKITNPSKPKDHEDQTETRLFYKADLRVLVDDATRQPRFFTGDVIYSNISHEATKNGTEIPMLITNVSTNAVSGAIQTHIYTNLTWSNLNVALNANGRMSDFRWNTNTTGNLGSQGISNVVTLDFDISRIITNQTLTPAIGTVITNSSGHKLNTPMSNWNGIVYLSNVDGTDKNQRGVRLLNGHVLPTYTNSSGKIIEGMTVVTDNPLYIVGDYNTGGIGTAVRSNNNNSNDSTWNLNNSTTTTYNRKPASIMADAVTIVSRNYVHGSNPRMNHANMNNNRKLTNADRTTVNTAIMSGYVKSTKDYLSGGVHNFPRFLEHWNGVKLVINGSLVNLFESEQATSVFYCNVGNELSNTYKSGKTFDPYYQPPTRVWNYDTNFDDPTKIPPGTPMVKKFVTGQWAMIP